MHAPSIAPDGEHAVVVVLAPGLVLRVVWPRSGRSWPVLELASGAVLACWAAARA